MQLTQQRFLVREYLGVKTHIGTVVRIFRIWTGVPDVVYLAGSFKLCIVVFLDVSPLQTCVSLKFTDKNFKQPNCFLLSMHAYRVYCYPVKLTIAHLIRAKSICSQTQFKFTDSVLFFAWTSLLRRLVHTNEPRSDISQYRPHARSISL